MSATLSKKTGRPISASALEFDFEEKSPLNLSDSILDAQIRVTQAQQDAEFAREETSRLRTKLQNAESDKSELLHEIAGFTADLEIYRGLEAKLLQQCSALKNDVKTLHSQSQALEDLNSALRHDFKSKQKASHLEMCQLKALADLLNKEKTAQSEIIESLQVQISSIQEENHQLKTRNIDSSAEAVATLNASKAECQELKERNQLLESRVTELLEEVKTSQTKNQSEFEKIEALCHKLEEQKDGLIKRLKKVESESIQAKTLLSQIARERAEEAEEKEANHVLREQLQKRERRLRIYSENVRHQQVQLRQIADELNAEINSGRSLHPLKDYLELTEFELHKHELQLMKTPTLSEDRSKLEAAVTQLIEQRDFLKTVITSSEKEFSERRRLLTSISMNEKDLITPPPPPRYSRSASTQEKSED